ncbi:hypothetical protein NSX56_24040, partial [Salmonella enterica]|nr:hypothetical protein [Salmonella enterica]
MADLVHSLAGEGAVTVEQPVIAGFNLTALPDLLRRSDELSDTALSQVEPKQAEAERGKLSKSLTQDGQISTARIQAP